MYIASSLASLQPDELKNNCDVEIVLASAEETLKKEFVDVLKNTALRNCTNSSVVLLSMSPTQWKLGLKKGCVKRFIMVINNGKGNILLLRDSLFVYFFCRKGKSKSKRSEALFRSAYRRLARNDDLLS